MSFHLRTKVLGWTIGRLRLSTFPPKVHSGPLRINILFFRNRAVSYFRIGQLYSRVIFISGNCELKFPAAFFDYFPAIVVCLLSSCISEIFGCREKIEHDRLNSNF